MHRTQMQSGFGLVEIVIGAAIMAVILFASAGYYQQSLKISTATSQKIQADYLVEEGLEAGRMWRDTSWSNVSGMASGTPYYLSWNGSTWATTTTPSLIDGTFDRYVVASPVSRDAASDQIVLSGGVVDTNTKKITAYVSWYDVARNATSTVSASTYLTNLFN